MTLNVNVPTPLPVTNRPDALIRMYVYGMISTSARALSRSTRLLRDLLPGSSTSPEMREIGSTVRFSNLGGAVAPIITWGEMDMQQVKTAVLHHQ